MRHRYPTDRQQQRQGAADQQQPKTWQQMQGPQHPDDHDQYGGQNRPAALAEAPWRQFRYRLAGRPTPDHFERQAQQEQTGDVAQDLEAGGLYTQRSQQAERDPGKGQHADGNEEAALPESCRFIGHRDDTESCGAAAARREQEPADDARQPSAEKGHQVAEHDLAHQRQPTETQEGADAADCERRGPATGERQPRHHGAQPVADIGDLAADDPIAESRGQMPIPPREQDSNAEKGRDQQKQAVEAHLLELERQDDPGLPEFSGKLGPGRRQQVEIVAQILQSLGEIAGCGLVWRAGFLRRRWLRSLVDCWLALQPLLHGGIAQQIQQQLDLMRRRAFGALLRLILLGGGRRGHGQRQTQPEQAGREPQPSRSPSAHDLHCVTPLDGCSAPLRREGYSETRERGNPWLLRYLIPCGAVPPKSRYARRRALPGLHPMVPTRQKAAPHHARRCGRILVRDP